jgi:hypothetical protein
VRIKADDRIDPIDVAISLEVSDMSVVRSSAE